MRTDQLKGAQMFGEAQRALQEGRPRLAIRIAQQLHRTNPKSASINSLLGAALVIVGHSALARKHLKMALAAAPNEKTLHTQMGTTYTMDGNFDEAQRWFARGLALEPGNTDIIGASAEAYQIAGDHARSYETMRPVLERPEGPTPGIANLFARIAPRLGKADEAVAYLRRHLDTAGMHTMHRMTMCFRLGDLLDAKKDYDGAFAAYREGNDLRRARGAYVPESYEALVSQLIEAWTPEAMRTLPRSAIRSDRPVFIVGMPRSGTSLVEQIIASHPKAYGAGELEDIGFMAGRLQKSKRSGMQVLHDLSVLTKRAVDEASREYFETLRDHNADAARITDKMPVNFQHLGLINLLAPGARVIHCIRNPMDTCLSCYFQLFIGHNMFSYGLDHVGHFFRQYERLMAHWRSVIDLPVLDVVYEDLVADQEAGTRRIIDFVGLPWDDACLRFHESSRVVMTASNEQVRRPMYKSSVERWRRYDKHLGPLKAALGVE